MLYARSCGLETEEAVGGEESWRSPRLRFDIADGYGQSGGRSDW